MKKAYLFFTIIFITALYSISCRYESITPTTSNNGNNNGNGGPNPTLKPCNTDTAYFENDVLPVFVSNCAKSGCHDAITKEEGVQTTDYATIMKNIKPFNLSDSKHYKSMTKKDVKDIMPPPPAKALSTAQLETIAKWILQGAKNNRCDANATGCDTKNVTFAKTIKPLMDKYCVGCHNATTTYGSVQLSDYQGIAKSAKAGSLYGSITHNASFSKMPKGGAKLDQCDIDKVKAWIDAGSLNN